MSGQGFTGFAVPTQNFFRMPNNWTDITAKIESLAELKVVEYVARHTWGYQEFGQTKAISNDEFMDGRKLQDGSRMDCGTGLSKPSVIDGLKRAVADGLLICDIDDTDKARIKKFYRLKMANSEVKNLDPSPSNQGLNILTPEVKNLDPRGKESRPRSEKETLERNSRKKDVAIATISHPVLAFSEQNTTHGHTPIELSTQANKVVDNSQPEPVATSNPIATDTHQPTEQTELIERPVKPEMPPTAMKLTPEKLVQITEALMGKYYTSKQRPIQLNAAKKIIAESVTEEQYITAYGDMRTWWNEHQGVLHVVDMAANTPRKQMRVLEIIEKVETRGHLTLVKSAPPVEKPYRPKAFNAADLPADVWA